MIHVSPDWVFDLMRDWILSCVSGSVRSYLCVGSHRREAMGIKYNVVSLTREIGFFRVCPEVFGFSRMYKPKATITHQCVGSDGEEALGTTK
jgi:hypothetical protein